MQIVHPTMSSDGKWFLMDKDGEWLGLYSTMKEAKSAGFSVPLQASGKFRIGETVANVKSIILSVGPFGLEVRINWDNERHQTIAALPDSTPAGVAAALRNVAEFIAEENRRGKI